MELICIGKLVNTHGIKGEVKLLSNFQYKELFFIKGKHVYIDNEELTINTYRKHKCFDMITFNEYNYINDILKFKGKKVYMNKDEIDLNGKVLDTDLIGLNAYYLDNNIGIIKDIINNNGYKLFLVNDKYIPYNNEFILSIDKDKIVFKNLGGII